MLDGTYYFECRCGTVEHTIRFTLDKKDKEIYAEFHLDPYHRWHKRIWLAIKYIFKQGLHYSHFDCWIMDENDVGRLKNMINEFENIRKEG